MSKQTLSVADFATILNLVNDRIYDFERIDEAWFFGKTKKELEEEQKEIDKRREERLKSSYYLQLKHLQESLQNLNVEVETPDVEVKK